jgi:hypothetical protein
LRRNDPLAADFLAYEEALLFDVREGDDISPDDEGMELATVEAVQAEASQGRSPKSARGTMGLALRLRSMMPQDDEPTSGPEPPSKPSRTRHGSLRSTLTI